MSKLDEMQNNFDERVTTRAVPQNNKIHVIKVEKEMNDRNNWCFAPKVVNTSSDSTINENNDIYNKTIPRLLDKSYTKTQFNKELTSFPSEEPKSSSILSRKEDNDLKVKMNSRQTQNRFNDVFKDRPKMSSDKVNSEGMVCRFCGRSFALTERLQKHESICNSVVDKSREKFDSVKQRFKGQPNEYLFSFEDSKNRDPKEPKKWNWRKKHEYCIASIREARGDSSTGPTTSQIMASIQQQCDYCKRRFNESAIKRHLPICAKLFRKKVMNY